MLVSIQAILDGIDENDLTTLQPVDSDIEMTNGLLSIGDRTLWRTREGIERFLITDINNPAASAKAQSEVPIMNDWVSTDGGQEFNHLPGGSNTLYLDGHVEFVRYPEKWPVNQMIAVLQGFDAD